MITTILVVYGIVFLFAAGFKLGNPFNEYSWFQVFAWPFGLILLFYEMLALLWRHKIYPIVELALVLLFNLKLPADETATNAYYQKCLRGEVRYAKWRVKAVKKLAKQNNIELVSESDYKDDR